MKTTIFRYIRFLLLAAFSSGWLIPLAASWYMLLDWIYFALHSEDKDFCSLGLEFSQGLFNFSCLWLGLVIIFWVVAAANRLWPVKNKKSDETSSTM